MITKAKAKNEILMEDLDYYILSPKPLGCMQNYPRDL